MIKIPPPIAQILLAPFAAIFGQFAIVFANSHGWYPQNQLANLMNDAINNEAARWIIFALLSLTIWLIVDFFSYRENSVFSRLRRTLTKLRPHSDNQIPYIQIRDLANLKGWNLSERDSTAHNRAYDLQTIIRQAASDGELKVWGRRFESPLGTNPLLPIPKEHFQEYEFQHGVLNYLNVSNESARTDKLGAHEKDLVGHVFCDLHVSRRDIQQLLAKVKPTSGIVGAS